MSNTNPKRLYYRTLNLFNRLKMLRQDTMDNKYYPETEELQASIAFLQLVLKGLDKRRRK